MTAFFMFSCFRGESFGLAISCCKRYAHRMDISIPIVGFIFVCIIFPKIVKTKPQFYMAFGVTLIILLLNVVANLTSSVAVSTTGGSTGFAKFLLILRDVLWIVDFILLVLATGGLSLNELSGELKGAYEVMRRGEDVKTVIIPLTGEKPKSREDAAAERAARSVLMPITPKKDESERTIPLD